MARQEGTRDLPTQAAELEAPPEEQPPQENHADEHAPKPKKQRKTRKADQLRVEAFVRNFTTPTSPDYLNARQAAITAGYSPRSAAAQASRMRKIPRIKEMIERSLVEMASLLATDGVIDVAWVERQHIEAMARYRMAGDRTNERENLECIGRMRGAYDLSLHLDLTVKHEYDERLAVERSRIARVLIEEAGDRGLTLLDATARLSPEAAPDAPGSTRTAPVGESVGGEGDRPAEGTLEGGAVAEGGDDGQ